MTGAILFGLFSLSTVIFNIITVIAIIRKKIAPSYFKIKLSLVLTAIDALIMGLLWMNNGRMGDYDFAWMLIFLSLIIWYAYIMATKPQK